MLRICEFMSNPSLMVQARQDLNEGMVGLHALQQLFPPAIGLSISLVIPLRPHSMVPNTGCVLRPILGSHFEC